MVSWGERESCKKQHFKAVLKALVSVGHLAYRMSKFGHELFENVLWRSRIHAGPKVRIHPTASIRNAGNVYIGENSHINIYCCVWAGRTSRIVLGKNVLMGPHVQIHASQHGMALGFPMMEQPRVDQGITIGDDVWLCGGAIVTPGVRIARGVVVGANAVVTKSVDEENVVVGGVPARIIGRRGGRKEGEKGQKPQQNCFNALSEGAC